MGEVRRVGRSKEIAAGGEKADFGRMGVRNWRSQEERSNEWRRRAEDGSRSGPVVEIQRTTGRVWKTDTEDVWE